MASQATDGFFLIAEASAAAMEDDFAILTSQRMNYQVLLSTEQTLLQVGLISAFILLFTQEEDGTQLNRCFRFWFMKEDEEAIKSIKLQIRDDEGFTEEVYNYTLCHFV